MGAVDPGMVFVEEHRAVFASTEHQLLSSCAERKQKKKKRKQIRLFGKRKQ
jgi:hypothetical protein